MFIAMSPDEALRLGLAHFDLVWNSRQLDGLLAFVAELERWNGKMNLTAIAGRERIITELLYDAFHLARAAHGARRLLDMGSGSGILAVPFAILAGDMEVFSVDSSEKKVRFQRHIKRTVNLGNLFPVHGRVEAIDPLNVDCVVAKAFGAVGDILPMAARHLAPHGRVLLPRGAGDAPPPDVEHFRLISRSPYTLPGLDKRFVMLRYEYSSEFGVGSSE